VASNSSIEWTESTWNPVTGCTKISPGCAHCYAERMARRLQAMGQRNYRNGFRVTLHPHALDMPLRWRKPQMIFVNSMSDLFHCDVPLEFIRNLSHAMAQAHWHVYQILTKRSERLLDCPADMQWHANTWLGVTVESADYVHRIDHLRRSNVPHRFISFEPLLGPVGTLDLAGIDWVIAGGESGPGARPAKEEWFVSIRDQCRRADVPFFFKQWGGVRKKRNGRTLQGRTHDDIPSAVSSALAG
jgi:protein gp37